MTLEQAQARIAALEFQLQQVRLTFSIHNSHAPEQTISQLAAYLNTEFFSDVLILAVIKALPNPVNRHTSPSAPLESATDQHSQTPMEYYPKEFLDYTEYLCDTVFEPRFHVIPFRADQGIGLLINPNEKHVLIDQYRTGLPDLLLKLFPLFLQEMDVRFGFPNVCTVSAPHSGSLSLYTLYEEAEHVASYSWNLPGNFHTHQELQFSPLSPEEQVMLNHLEREFSGNIEQLLFFEAAAVLDRILDMEFTHAYPVSQVISGTTARLRNVIAVAEALADINTDGLMEMDHMVFKLSSSVSIPEFRDRVHDFFASVADLGPKQSRRKGLVILDFIESNYKNPALGAQMICDRFRISHTYLSRLIKQETNSGLVDCIQKYRVAAAKQLLLSTQLGIEPIALQVGFSNRYGLVRAFNRLENTTPDNWRHQYHTDHE